MIEDNKETTISLLRHRMLDREDFPVFSQTLSALNQASSSETDSLTSISNSILKDYSLTNKVLRLVNSVYYNRGGDKIGTISRAVVMLGINRVRSIAATLMLFDHLQNRQQVSQLKEAAVMSLFSGLVANDLASSLGIPNQEEAFLCAMLQQLGKMLVRFYLPDESQAIAQLVEQEGLDETRAVSRVLDSSYAKLGIAVAREWGFPDLITDSMLPLDFEQLPTGQTAPVRLKLISQFSNALGACLSLELEQQAPAIRNLTRQFSRVLKIDEESVSRLIENSHRELAEFSRLIQFDLTQSHLYQQISSAAIAEAEAEDCEQTQPESVDGVEYLADHSESQSASVEKALADGIQDITNTLTGEFTINQVMQMILETIYRALQGSRVVLCLKDRKSASIKARLGYGEGVDAIIEHFVIPQAMQNDVFHIAFKKNVDIHIENTAAEKISSKIPDWYHNHIASSSFTLFPIVIKNLPVALIYIDSPMQDPIRITDNQLSLLKTLRNQAILAIKTLSLS